MGKGPDKSVSVGFWLFALLVMAIPLINILMTFVWAFAGGNESRKNFFKALIIFWVALVFLIIVFGLLPLILQVIQSIKIPGLK